jgi:hypothetical protein
LRDALVRGRINWYLDYGESFRAQMFNVGSFVCSALLPQLLECHIERCGGRGNLSHGCGQIQTTTIPARQEVRQVRCGQN